jgi:bifunctional non-homologous end joining protein LigD
MTHQLPLPLDPDDADSGRALPAHLPFSVATDGGQPFDDVERYFEPWWPGAQAFLRRSGDHLEIRTEHLSDPLVIFPELRPGLRGLAADGVIIEGTLLALDDAGRPNAGLLRRRLAGVAGPDTIAEGAFVGADLLYVEGRPLARQPFVERRRQLASVLPDSEHVVVNRGLVGEGITLGRAVASLGLDGISARRLDGRWRPGPAGDAWLRLHTAETPTLPPRPFLVLLEKLPLRD